MHSTIKSSVLTPALFVLFMLALIGGSLRLGLWQLDRLAWKESLIRDINLHHERPPATLTLPPQNSLPLFSWHKIATKINPRDFIGIEAVLPSNHPQHPALGYRVVAPFWLEEPRGTMGSPRPHQGILEVGWVTKSDLDDLVNARTRTIDQDIPKDLVIDVVGIAQPSPATGSAGGSRKFWEPTPRFQSPHTMSALDIPMLRHHWHHNGSPIPSRKASRNQSEGALDPPPFLGYFKVVAHPDYPNRRPPPGKIWIPPYVPQLLSNNHLNYAITWFGMALVGFLMLAMWGYGWYKSSKNAG